MKDGLRARIDAMVRRLERQEVNLHGFLLSVDGEEKARAVYAPFAQERPHRMYSVSKTMTGIAVGFLMAEGKAALSDRVCSFFEDWVPSDAHPWLKELTIGDMLRMATCYRATRYREGIDPNWALPFFTGTPTHAPGTVFHYDTGCSQVLAALVKRVSGQEVFDLLEARLFSPLGCRDERYWLRDPSGCCQGGTGLCMSLRDLHRVGQCLLNGGEGIVPEEYVREMGKKHIDTPLQTNDEERFGYGWQCWRTRAGWSMYGLGGQLAVVCPEKNTLFTTIADTRLDPFGVQRIYDAFFEEVYPFIGVEDTAPVLLERKAPFLCDRAAPGLRESGEYFFEAGNPLALRRLALRGDCLVYENGRGEVTLPFGRGENRQIAYPGWAGVPALASGGWITERMLQVRCHAVGDAPCGFEMLLAFGDGRVTVQARRSHDPVTEGYEGVATGTLR